MASSPPAGRPTTPLRRSLVSITDSVAQTHGAGVVFTHDGRLERLRGTGASGITVVYELRRRSVAPQFPIPPLLRAPAPRPAAQRRSPPRTAATSPATEWTNLGFDCTGAALAWVGVVGLSALAPVTAGTSVYAAALLYGGAIAASGQCAVSVLRTSNLYTGNTAINRRLDNSDVYRWTMRGADFVGVIGAGAALKQLKTTHTVLKANGFTWSHSANSGLSRPVRLRLTAALSLQGSRRVSGPMINRFVKQRLLDGVAGVIGLTASARNGVVNDIVVWIVGAPEKGI